jgi:hypothetical protein
VVLNILYACAIMHNMIIKDERNVSLEHCFDVVNIHIKCGFTITKYTQCNKHIENVDIHYKSYNALIDYH